MGVPLAAAPAAVLILAAAALLLLLIGSAKQKSRLMSAAQTAGGPAEVHAATAPGAAKPASEWSAPIYDWL